MHQQHVLGFPESFLSKDLQQWNDNLWDVLDQINNENRDHLCSKHAKAILIGLPIHCIVDLAEVQIRVASFFDFDVVIEERDEKTRIECVAKCEHEHLKNVGILV